jgi:hypothetical protein
MEELFLLVPNAPDICQGEGKLELVRNLAVNILLEEGEQREIEPRPFGVLALTEGNNRSIKPHQGYQTTRRQSINPTAPRRQSVNQTTPRRQLINRTTPRMQSINPTPRAYRSIKPHQGGYRSIKPPVAIDQSY